jgi:hypothetical protein
MNGRPELDPAKATCAGVEELAPEMNPNMLDDADEIG